MPPTVGPHQDLLRRRRTRETRTGQGNPAIPFGPDSDYYEDPEIERRADVYVFAYYAERDPAQYSSLNVRGWRFYVLSTLEIDQHFGNQERVALSRVQAVTEEVEYGDLKAKVDAVLDRAETQGV